MKYILSIIILLSISSIPNVYASTAVPSPFCLGSCQTHTKSSSQTAPATSGSPDNTMSTQPSSTQNTPSSSPANSLPSATSPCITNQAVHSKSTGAVTAFHHTEKYHASDGSGLLQQLVQFLLQFLQLLFQQLGMQFPSTNTSPCLNPAPSKAIVPSGIVDTSPSSAPSSTQPSGISSPTIYNVTSPAFSTDAPATSGSQVPAGIPGKWKLLFDDEFNGTSLDTSKWAPYWFRNGATQNNTKMETANVSESGGTLNLTVTGNTGGIVSTNPSAGGHFQFTYGAVEARIYLPASGNQIANWPAWWTDGQNWPADGEMDVMEGLGGPACYHFHDPSGGPGGCVSGNFSGWHTYGADWQKGIVTYYYDGKKVGSISSGITSSPMYLILENSLGRPSVTPATMKVDYIRVWQ